MRHAEGAGADLGRPRARGCPSVACAAVLVGQARPVRAAAPSARRDVRAARTGAARLARRRCDRRRRARVATPCHLARRRRQRRLPLQRAARGRPHRPPSSSSSCRRRAYARSRQPGLRDLRIVDARGERVPFALLPVRPRCGRAQHESRAMPAVPVAGRGRRGRRLGRADRSRVHGDRIQVTRRAGEPRRQRAGAGAARAAGCSTSARTRSPSRRAAARCALAWSGPAEFAAAFTLETSADLRDLAPRRQRPAAGAASPRAR